MALSAFGDKTRPPTDRELAATLGATFELWQAVQERLGAEIPPTTVVWGYTSKSTGWGLRVKRGERVIVYLTPGDGHFLASFALGEKAVAAARNSGLPADTLGAIEGAKKYAEGRAVRFRVETTADVTVVAKLAAIKTAN